MREIYVTTDDGSQHTFRYEGDEHKFIGRMMRLPFICDDDGEYVSTDHIVSLFASAEMEED